MSPKAKAKELVEKFRPYVDETKKAKQCALICADEIMVVCLAVNYWQEVKQEIEKL